jgi:hypothetical protein
VLVFAAISAFWTTPSQQWLQFQEAEDVEGVELQIRQAVKEKTWGACCRKPACESTLPCPSPYPCHQLQERGSARINASWGKEVINPAVSNKNGTFHAGETQGSCPSGELGARIIFYQIGDEMFVI